MPRRETLCSHPECWKFIEQNQYACFDHWNLLQDQIKEEIRKAFQVYIESDRTNATGVMAAHKKAKESWRKNEKL